MERRLLCYSATVGILPMGCHTEAWSTSDQCYNTRSCYQHHADYISGGCVQKRSWTTKTGLDRTLQAKRGYP